LNRKNATQIDRYQLFLIKGYILSFLLEASFTGGMVDETISNPK
jgi:hypothetical protein